MVTVYRDPTFEGVGSALGSALSRALERRADRLERQSVRDQQVAREDELKSRQTQTYGLIGDLLNDPGALPEGQNWEDLNPFQQYAHLLQVGSERGADPGILGGVLNNLLGQQLGVQKETAGRNLELEKAKIAAESPKRAIPETTEQKELGKAQIKRNTELKKQGSEAQKMLSLIPEVKQAIPKAGAGNWNNVFGVGPIVRKTKELFGESSYNRYDQVLNNFSKDWIKSMSPRWGANVTNQQTKLSRAMTVSPEKSPEANMKAIQLNEIALQAAANEAQIISDLEAQYLENGGRLPPNFDSIVREVQNDLGKRSGDALLRGAKELGFDVNVNEIFENLPDAKKFPGKIARDNKSGKKFKSINGKWVAQ